MNQLRQHLIAALRGGLAYDTFDSLIAEYEPSERGVVPDGAEHSAWQILEHMRLSLRDILDYCRNEEGTYEEKKWPEEYWPTQTAPSGNEWERSAEAYRSDLRQFEALIQDENRDLFQPFPWGEGQTLLREALLVTDHAAYHLGELVELKRWVSSTRR